ncbi:hypothetical protein GGS21DRAFT_506894 [Xylaria nigripes]|nr:hypothetical protein GGS21DRAFT_506894 [Xylaria nigripes]
MDFSQAYFTQHQPYHYMGMATLTPTHSNPTPPNQSPHVRSPMELYDFRSPDQFSPTFDQYAQFGHHNQSMPCPPGPPTPPTLSMHGQSHRDLNSGYPVEGGRADMLPLTNSEPDTNRPAGSNSDDDDLSPAQSRRKAQNRAAQRAFRERKERHVKDLEAKLASLEAAQSQTATENEKLKREMQKMSTENEILRATSSAHVQNARVSSSSPVSDITTGPMQYNSDDFYSHLLQNHQNKNRSHRIVEAGGQRLLAAGATWDYIINHELFKKGLIDVGDVSDRLKFQAQCDGQGPVFPESVILQAIMESVASSSDELL